MKLYLRGDGTVAWQCQSQYATPTGEVVDDESDESEPTVSCEGVFGPDHCYKTVESSIQQQLNAFAVQAIDALLAKLDAVPSGPGPECNAKRRS
jgi:hypothetical protein